MAILLTITALAALADSGEDDDARAIRLVDEDGSGVRQASVPLNSRLGRSTDGWRSARVVTTSYSLLAVTWRGEEVSAQVRTHGPEGWSDWQQLEPLKQADSGVQGTELIWVPDSDGFEVKVDQEREDLAVELIDPGETATVSAKALAPGDEKKTAPRPRLFTRDDWGANEDWRNGGPYYTRTVKQVHIHHTATGNDYQPRDVPGIIRGMYRYHTKSLGWSDLGYNFVVDRWGRTWVGRHGGYWRPVRGAHTLGFNHVSTGIAVLGNFEKHRVSRKAITAIVHLAAYKLDRYDRNPAKKVKLTSAGSDLYRPGKQLWLRVIDGHRDTNQTACPGDRLYNKLWRIRWRTQDRVDRFSPRG